VAKVLFQRIGSLDILDNLGHKSRGNARNAVGHDGARKVSNDSGLKREKR
jgi:hypothetical protein